MKRELPATLPSCRPQHSCSQWGRGRAVPAPGETPGGGQGGRGRDTPGAGLGLRPPACPSSASGREPGLLGCGRAAVSHWPRAILGSLRERPACSVLAVCSGPVRDVPPCVSLGWTAPGPALCPESRGPGRSPGPCCGLRGSSLNSRAAASPLSVHPALRWASFLNPRGYMEAGAGGGAQPTVEAGAGPWTHGALPQLL